MKFIKVVCVALVLTHVPVLADGRDDFYALVAEMNVDFKSISDRYRQMWGDGRLMVVRKKTGLDAIDDALDNLRSREKDEKAIARKINWSGGCDAGFFNALKDGSNKLNLVILKAGVLGKKIEGNIFDAHGYAMYKTVAEFRKKFYDAIQLELYIQCEGVFK